MSDAPGQDTPSQEKVLALIEGRSDDEIVAEVERRGVDNVLEQVFNGMASRFQPAKAGDREAVVQWDTRVGGDTHTWQLQVADGTCVARRGAESQPRVTLGMAVPDLLRFVAGQLDGMRAFMTGKLRVSGDLLFAQSMSSWFQR